MRHPDVDFSRLDPILFQPCKYDGEGQIDSDWLKKARPEKQRTAMLKWFCARFETPDWSLPAYHADDELIFLYGGPFDPEEILTQKYLGIADSQCIDDVVEVLHGYGTKWSPRIGSEYSSFDFDVHVKAADEPLHRLIDRSQESIEILELTGSALVRSRAEQMVFGALVANLEAFLWETAHYWVNEREEIVRACIENIQFFSEQKVSMGQIYELQSQAKAKVNDYLRNLVWHRWDTVAALYAKGIGVTLPDITQFKDALQKRHDIVHRSGHDHEHKPVSVTTEEVRGLADKINEFAGELNRALAAKFAGSMSRTSLDIDF